MPLSKTCIDTLFSSTFFTSSYIFLVLTAYHIPGFSITSSNINHIYLLAGLGNLEINTFAFLSPVSIVGLTLTGAIRHPHSSTSTTTSTITTTTTSQCASLVTGGRLRWQLLQPLPPAPRLKHLRHATHWQAVSHKGFQTNGRRSGAN